MCTQTCTHSGPQPHISVLSRLASGCRERETGGPTIEPAVPDSLAALGPTFPHSIELCSSDILEQLSCSVSNAAVMVREGGTERGRGGKRMKQALCVLAYYAQYLRSSLLYPLCKLILNPFIVFSSAKTMVFWKHPIRISCH